MAQACVICGGDLERISTGYGAAGVCSCGGVWLDNSLCEQLLSGSLIEAARERLHALVDGAKRPEQKPVNYRTPDRTMGRARLCMECGQPLALMDTDPTVHGVTIRLDVCEDHGVWFDPGEAWCLLQSIELMKIGAGFDADTDAPPWQ